MESEEILEEQEQKKELEEEIVKEKEHKKEEQQKKKVDDLWASFLSDVKKPPAKPKAASSGLGALSSTVKVCASFT